MSKGIPLVEERIGRRWLSGELYHALLSRYLVSSFWMGVLFIVTYLVFSALAFARFLILPLAVVGVAMAVIQVALLLSRRGYDRMAAYLYFVTIFLSLFIVMSYLGGPFSVLSLTILVNMSLVAILEGRRGIFVATLFVAVAMLFLISAMSIGIIHPFPLVDPDIPASLWANGIILVSNIAMELYMLLEFSRVVEMAWREAVVRGDALEEMSRQAEKIARAEQELRRRETERLERLRKLVDTYVTFMERLRMGDYSVRLDLPPEESEVEEDPVLQLGYHLNATAESWKRMLADIRRARDHYLLTAWSRFLEGQRWQNVTFRLRGDEEHVNRHPEPGEAISADRIVAEGGELRVPLRMGALSLGVIVLRRGDDRPWTEDEVETVRALVPPLVQTIDNLRLVEESRDRAAREQLSSRIADRMRESLDLETVLRTAAQELGEAFRLREVVVQLSPSRESAEEAA